MVAGANSCHGHMGIMLLAEMLRPACTQPCATAQQPLHPAAFFFPAERIKTGQSFIQLAERTPSSGVFLSCGKNKNRPILIDPLGAMLSITIPHGDNTIRVQTPEHIKEHGHFCTLIVVSDVLFRQQVLPELICISIFLYRIIKGLLK